MGEPGRAIRDRPDRNDDAGRKILDAPVLVPRGPCVDTGRLLVDAAFPVLYIGERIAADHGGHHFNGGHGSLGCRPVAPVFRGLVVGRLALTVRILRNLPDFV